MFRDGGPTYVLGTAGGHRIISAIVAVVSRIVDQGLSLEQAMAAPRFHPTTATLYAEAREEAGWPANDLALLREFGLDQSPRASAPYFARLHAVAFLSESAIYLGVADPRWSGAAGGARR